MFKNTLTVVDEPNEHNNISNVWAFMLHRTLNTPGRKSGRNNINRDSVQFSIRILITTLSNCSVQNFVNKEHNFMYSCTKIFIRETMISRTNYSNDAY